MTIRPKIITLKNPPLAESQRLNAFEEESHARFIQNENQLRLTGPKSLFSWWISERTNTHLPCKTDFDILKHFRFAPNIYLLEQLSEQQFRFVISGEEVTEIFGRDPYKKIIDTNQPAPALNDHGKELIDQSFLDHADVVKYFNEILQRQQCRSCTGSTTLSGRPFRKFESIDCPLSDRHGQPKYILGCLQLTAL